MAQRFLFAFAVALREESVDRNKLILVLLFLQLLVALREESVDRNSFWISFVRIFSGRSP